MTFDLSKLRPAAINNIKINGDGCWLWTGYINQAGYGVVHYDYGKQMAHRHVYEALVGSIPDGLQLDHLCRVRACVNPEHVEPVTLEENLKRGRIFQPPTVFCPQGHSLEGDNAYTPPNSAAKQCRECRRVRNRESKRVNRRLKFQV